jgi:hypothetical protein
MQKFVHILKVRDQFLGSLNDKGPWEVNFTIHPYDEEYEAPRTSETALAGYVNWQDGITLYGIEHMEPADFSAIMDAALVAIEAAKEAMGENWDLGHPR